MNELIKAVEMLGAKVFKMEFPCGPGYAFRGEGCKGCSDYAECLEFVNQKRDFDDLISQAKGPVS